MQPNIWGKYGWNFIHLVALDYPINPTSEDMDNYRNFFYSLQYVLPCQKCRLNFVNHVSKYPLTNKILSNRESLLQWTIDLHNIVNYNTGKQMLTYDEALKKINDIVNPPKSFNTIYLIIIIIIIIIIITLCFFRSRYY